MILCQITQTGKVVKCFTTVDIKGTPTATIPTVNTPPDTNSSVLKTEPTATPIRIATNWELLMVVGFVVDCVSGLKLNYLREFLAL